MVDFVASRLLPIRSTLLPVYGAKATRSTLWTFDKVDRVEFNFVVSVYRAVCHLSNGAISNDLECWISRPRFSLTLNNSKMVPVPRPSNNFFTSCVLKVFP